MTESYPGDGQDEASEILVTADDQPTDSIVVDRERSVMSAAEEEAARQSRLAALAADRESRRAIFNPFHDVVFRPERY